MSSANTYTTDDLVDDILLLGHIPTGNNTFGSSEVLRIATMLQQTSVTAQILNTRGGYYLTYEDFDANDDGLYMIPDGCTAGAVVNVEMIQNTTIVPVNIIEESEQFSTISPTTTSYGCFFKGNYVQILPTPPIGDVRLWYTQRTSDLVSTSACAKITSISGAAYTCSTVPSTMSEDTSVDVLGDQPPFNILDTRTIEDVSGTTITLDEEVDGVAVGDWIALEDQTCVPQIPVEFRLLLAQEVVVKIYELQGYLDKLARAKEALEKYRTDTFNLITPRIKSQTKVINPINGGFLKGNRNRMTNFPASKDQ